MSSFYMTEDGQIGRIPDVAEAARLAAAKAGVSLQPLQAKAIAEAVRAYADVTVSTRQFVVRDMWDIADCRDSVRRDMRLSLLDQIARKGLVPAAVPSEKLRYLESRFGVEKYAGVSASAGWDTVEITLEVGAWTPSSGRPDAPQVPFAEENPALCLVKTFSGHFRWKYPGVLALASNPF